MIKPIAVSLLIMTFVFSMSPLMAGTDKELREQQKAAHKARDLQKRERTRLIREAQKEFKQYSRDLDIDYTRQVKALDVQFQLDRVELESNHAVKVADAEAEFQKKLLAHFMSHKNDSSNSEAMLNSLQAEAKVFADELFALKKQSAQELHQARVGNEQNKNTLLTQKDQLVLGKAKALGLTEAISPIIARPIGDALTSREKKWNEKEQREVVKLKERNLKLIKGETRNGEALRKWQIDNLDEDFNLTWEKHAELHALDFQARLNSMILTPGQQNEPDRAQNIMSDMAELNKQKRLIEIKYKKIHEQNKIKRKSKKREILSQ
jgi:hypothetical protein